MGYFLSTPYDKIHDLFLAYQKPRVSKQGYKKLMGQTCRVLRWFEREELLLEEVTIREAVRYQASISELVTREGTPVSTGTLINYLKTARSLFAWLVETERVKTNSFSELVYPKMPEHLSRNSLTEAQMGCLLAQLARFNELENPLARIRRYRVHIVAEFLYATGLRIAEAASLIDANLDLASRLVYLPEGKGGRARTAFLSGYAAELMARYLTRGREMVFAHYPRSHGQTIFGVDTARLAAVVNEELRMVCGKLNIPIITSHGFRHSLGTHLLRAGCDMRHIQAILGHQSLATTQIYTKVNNDDLKRSLDAFHPRKWREPYRETTATIHEQS